MTLKLFSGPWGKMIHDKKKLKQIAKNLAPLSLSVKLATSLLVYYLE
jgi:hypothetical protein